MYKCSFLCMLTVHHHLLALRKVVATDLRIRLAFSFLFFSWLYFNLELGYWSMATCYRVFIILNGEVEFPIIPFTNSMTCSGH